MSRIVEIVVPEVPNASSGLVEQFASFSGEPEESDPRAFQFGDRLDLTLRPTAPHVLARLAEELGSDAVSLVLDEATVIEWSAGRLIESDAALLRTLFERIARPYAVVVEAGVGEGVRTSAAVAASVFGIIDPIVRGETSEDLTLVLVDSDCAWRITAS